MCPFGRGYCVLSDSNVGLNSVRRNGPGMQGRGLAPLVGIVASLAAIGLVVAPYFVVDSLSVGTYYGTAILGPWVVALFGVVAAIVLLAGVQKRTDPATVAGASLVFGTAMVLIAAIWALSVPGELVFQLGQVEALSYHRWALVGVSAVVPASAAWYAAETL